MYVHDDMLSIINKTNNDTREINVDVELWDSLIAKERVAFENGRDYLTRGLYYFQLRNVYKYFKKCQVLTVIMEEMHGRNELTNFNKILQHIHVQPLKENGYNFVLANNGDKKDASRNRK